jgi:hypothetical protein
VLWLIKVFEDGILVVSILLVYMILLKDIYVIVGDIFFVVWEDLTF